MKKIQVLILLIFIMSCKGRDEKMLYINHITEVENIVAANDSIKDLEMLLSEYGGKHDDVGQMVVMRKLGEKHRESSDFKVALDYHEKALLLAKELKDTANIINILNQLGVDFRRLGMLSEAANRFYESLSYIGKYSDGDPPP